MIATAPNLTDRGKSLLLRAIAGEAITFTRFKVGSGTLPEGETGDGLNDLVHPELAFAITDMDDTQEGLLALTGEFDNEEVEEDFAWREMGIFARGEDNIEILYAYANDGDNASIVRQLNTDVLTIQTVTMIIAIGEAENVTAVYSPHRQYALADDLNNHTANKNNPHQVTKEQIGLNNVPNVAPKDLEIPFTEAQAQENIASGEKLSVLFGKIKKVISSVIAHLNNTDNPHNVTLATVGGAAQNHKHGAADINAGTLDLARGGTGVNSLSELKALIGTNAVMSIYVGNGTVKRLIDVGFQPSAVILMNDHGQTWDDTLGVCGGMAIGINGLRDKASTLPAHATAWDDDHTALLIDEDGFYVNSVTGTNAEESIATNAQDMIYRYIAYK